VQARQRRKELDPAAAAKAAAQQQELQLLQDTQRRNRQQADADSSGSMEPLSMSAEVAAAAAAAAQDEQLQLLLEQLRGNAAARAPGSSSGRSAGSPLPGGMMTGLQADDADCIGDAADEVDEEEVEEELGLDDGLESSQDAAGDDEDYAQALALAAASESSAPAALVAADSSTAARQAVAGAAGVGSGTAAAAAAAAAGRAWRLVMASLEDEAFAAMLPPCKAAFPPAAQPAAMQMAALEGCLTAAEQQQVPDSALAACIVEAGEGDDVPADDDSGLPELLQSPDSPTSSPRHRNKQQHDSDGVVTLQQQQDMQEFSSLEQQLESALKQSDAAAAQQLISSIYRMSLSLKPASSSMHDACDAELQGSSSSQRPVVTSFRRCVKQRPKSAAEEQRDRSASEAMTQVVNQMIGNVLMAPAGGAQGSAGSSRSGSRRTSGHLACIAEAGGVTAAAAETNMAGIGMGLSIDRNSSSKLSSSRRSSTAASEQQPKMALVGGLNTSWPAAVAAAPPAVQVPSFLTSWKSSGRDTPGSAASNASSSSSWQYSPSGGTPRVDDALSLLRGHGGAGSKGSSSTSSSRRGQPTAAKAAPAAANAARSSTLAGRAEQGSRAGITKALGAASTGRLSAGRLSAATAAGGAAGSAADSLHIAGSHIEGRSSSAASSRMNASGARAGATVTGKKPTTAPAPAAATGSAQQQQSAAGRPKSAAALGRLAMPGSRG
jgi:hypothetical protein